jgi:hypothetical protein
VINTHIWELLGTYGGEHAAGRLPLVRLGHLFLPRLSPLSYADLSSSFLKFFVDSINADEEFLEDKKS